MIQFQVYVERLLCVVLVDVSASDMHTDIESCFFHLCFFSSGILGHMPFISLFHEPAKKKKKLHLEVKTNLVVPLEHFCYVVSCLQPIWLQSKPTEPNHIQKVHRDTQWDITAHQSSRTPLFPAQWIHPIPFKYSTDFTYIHSVKPCINPATYGELGNRVLSSRLARWLIVLCGVLTLTEFPAYLRKYTDPDKSSVPTNY